MGGNKTKHKAPPIVVRLLCRAIGYAFSPFRSGVRLVPSRYSFAKREEREDFWEELNHLRPSLDALRALLKRQEKRLGTSLVWGRVYIVGGLVWDRV